MENKCPWCEKVVFKLSKDGSRIKAPTSILVLHKSGDVEINCGHCRKGVLLPLAAKEGHKQLRKAVPDRMHFLKRDP